MNIMDKVAEKADDLEEKFNVFCTSNHSKAADYIIELIEDIEDNEDEVEKLARQMKGEEIPIIEDKTIGHQVTPEEAKGALEEYKEANTHCVELYIGYEDIGYLFELDAWRGGGENYDTSVSLLSVEKKERCL